MRFKPAFLLCPVVLFAALPVWADRSPSPVFASGSHSFDFDKVALDSSKQSNAAAALIDNSEAITTNSWGSDFRVAPYTFVSTSPSVQPVSLSDLAIFGISSSKPKIGDALWAPREGGEFGVLSPARHPDRQHHTHAELVPEPGSLPLVLIGLVAIGFVSRRRPRLA